MWCVGYYYPIYNLQGEINIENTVFPEGRDTLFTCAPILVYTYNYGDCAYISSMLIVQGNPMFEMPAKYIFHSIVVGVEYYNYIFDSGHQESSQSFTMNCMFRPL